MVKRQKGWFYRPSKLPKPEVPDTVKLELETKAKELIETTLRPRNIKSPPVDTSFNYIVAIYIKWYRNYFYFCSKYRCRAPNRISDFFEAKFARLEYIRNGNFNLSYMRHTGQWWEIHRGLSVDECLSAIRDEPHFIP